MHRAENILTADDAFCQDAALMRTAVFNGADASVHDWKISLEDGIVQEPDHGCVKTYETLIEGEHVYLVY